MAATLLVCPKCAARFPAVSPRARCPHCGAEAARRARGDVPVARPHTPPPGYPAPAEPPASGPSRSALILVLAGASALLLAGAGVVIAVAISGGRGKPAAVAEGTPRESKRVDQEPPARPAEVVHGEPAEPVTPPKPGPADPAPPPTSLSEQEQQEVNKAIARGVAYLKKQNTTAGPMGNQRFSGLHPLVGLTLLECGVPADDVVLTNLTKHIRAGAARLSETYSLSLTILFLDKLGDPQDEPLIRHLAARLIAGQDEAGGWTYECPGLSEPDGQLFLTYLDTHPLPGRSAPGPELPHVVRPGEPSRTPADTGRSDKPVLRTQLPPVVRDRAVVTFDPARQIRLNLGDDNSNTQFAVLGVWAARRHGVPVGRSVALISARFRRSQNDDGSWGYNLNTKLRRDSMTCAGLLGLAVARAEGGTESADKDPAISRGLEFLGRRLQVLSDVKKRPKGKGHDLQIGAQSIGDLYWLWSLERVGVIYSLTTLGGKDWYAWGAGLIVAAQRDDGSWVAGQGEVVDTCFALLFLGRVNVAKDLTRQLQNLGRIRDPGQ